MIKVKNLTKSFDGKKALDDISFEIKTGEICGFVGENGAGKSTTMRIISTLTLDYEGEIIIDGKLLSKNIEETREIIGFMPDQYGLYEDMSVTEYLEFFMLSYFGAINELKIERVLKSVFLLDEKDKKIGGLSRGMTQRILLAKALISSPKILILDEPASGLDPALRIELKKLLLNLKQEGITIFVSSHILSELGEYCDNIIFISKGKIIKKGNLEQLREEVSGSKLYIKTDDNLKAKEILNSIKLVNKISKKDGFIELEIGDTKTNTILGELIKNQLEIKELTKNPSSLEDIYLDINS